MTNLSVVIPVHNRYDLLELCLSMWRRQARRKNFFWEILLIDDNSDPPLEDWFKDAPGIKPNHTRVIRLKHDLGLRSPATAYQTGIEEAQGDVIALSSQDVLVPRQAALATYDAAIERAPLRVGMLTLWTTETMLAHIALNPAPWQKDLRAVEAIPGFWTDMTPYGGINKDIGCYGHMGMTAMTREAWGWMGGIRKAPQYGMDDRDLMEREAFLDRPCREVPSLYCVHLWHPRANKVSHPGFIYSTEAQARLQEPAVPKGNIPSLQEIRERAAGEAGAQLGIVSSTTPGAAPSHVISLFDHLLDILTSEGISSVALSNDDYWPDHFIEMAHYRDIRAIREADGGEAEAIVSLMQLQRHARFEDAWDTKNRWLGQYRRLVIMVPHCDHFHSGGNLLMFEPASLQAPKTDESQTGYLIGIW